MFSSLLIWLAAFWEALIITAAPNDGKCYNPNRDQGVDFLPCYPEAEVSPCCLQGDSCLSNGLCQSSANGTLTPYFTGQCTDFTWSSPSVCPEICNNNKTRQVCSHDAKLSGYMTQLTYTLQRNANFKFPLSMPCCHGNPLCTSC